MILANILFTALKLGQFTISKPRFVRAIALDKCLILTVFDLTFNFHLSSSQLLKPKATI